MTLNIARLSRYEQQVGPQQDFAGVADGLDGVDLDAGGGRVDVVVCEKRLQLIVQCGSGNGSGRAAGRLDDLQRIGRS